MADSPAPGPGPDADGAPPDGAAGLRARLGQLERELGRLRRSRRVLMDLLWRLDRDWRLRLATLEEENRRLWARRERQGPA